MLYFGQGEKPTTTKGNKMEIKFNCRQGHFGVSAIDAETLLCRYCFEQDVFEDRPFRAYKP